MGFERFFPAFKQHLMSDLKPPLVPKAIVDEFNSQICHRQGNAVNHVPCRFVPQELIRKLSAIWGNTQCVE